MRKAIYNAKTKKTTYIEVEGSEIAELEDYTQEPNLEERLESIKTQNELALAELAEVVLGGML